MPAPILLKGHFESEPPVRLTVKLSPQPCQPLPQCRAVLESKWGWSVLLAQTGVWARVLAASHSCSLNPPPLPSFMIKQACVHSSRVESRLPTALLLVPLALQPAKGGGLSSLCGTPWLGCSIFGSNHSLSRVDLHLCNLFSSGNLPRGTGQNLMASHPFLPDSMWIFLTALIVQESLYQTPISFL